MNTAPRHIPATPDDLTGWCGRPVRVCGKCGSKNIRVDCSICGDSTFDHECNDGCRDCGGPEIRAFDTRDAAHRDHLIRRYALPDWHRDTPGGLTPEQSAGLVLGSVLRVRAGMNPIRALAQRRRAYHYAVLAGDPALLIGINARDEDVTGRGGALLTPTGILLPPLTPGGEPALWSTG